MNTTSQPNDDATRSCAPVAGSEPSKDDIYYCYACYVACLTGEDACLSHDDAKRLHALGLIELREGPGDDMDEDTPFHFVMTDRGEALAKKQRDVWSPQNTGGKP